MKHIIAQTHNGFVVYTDLIKSPAAAHISAQPHLLGLVKEALVRTNINSKSVRMEQDMGRDIGYDYVAKTTADDTVFYAQLLKSDIYTSFIKNGKPAATRYLTIIMQKDVNGEYELHDTWIGRLNPPLPGSEDETDASKTYWDNHARIFDKQPLKMSTITKVSPY